MSSHLFSPLTLAGLALPNRIVVSPMCQYSAVEGVATDWHMMHIVQYALSGAAVFMIEATAVERAGRITHGCLGLYNDEQEQALARILNAARRYGSAHIGIQIGDTRTLDVHIRWLRKVVEPNPRKPQYITTVRGEGYCFVIPAA